MESFLNRNVMLRKRSMFFLYQAYYVEEKLHQSFYNSTLHVSHVREIKQTFEAYHQTCLTFKRPRDLVLKKLSKTFFVGLKSVSRWGKIFGSICKKIVAGMFIHTPIC